MVTDQARYLDTVRRIVDNGLQEVRSSYGSISEFDGSSRGEANCTADLVRIETMLGLNGDPEYLDDTEQIVRNYLLASQFLDPSLAAWPDISGDPARDNQPADTQQAIHKDAAVRCSGEFSFTSPMVW